MKGFNYAEFSSEELGLFVIDVKKDTIGDITTSSVKLPGRTGEVYKGAEIGSKKIDIECFAVGLKSDTERNTLLQEIAGFIGQTTDGDLYPLILEHEQDITYWVYPTGVSEFTRANATATEGSFTLSFICPEGKGYKEQIEQQLTTPTFELSAEGTAPTAPVFTVNVEKDIKKLGISDTDGNYIYIGNGFNVDDADEQINMKPRVLYDPCTTLATWTKVTENTLTFNIENGYISSDADITTSSNSLEPIKKDGDYFYGTAKEGQKGWHGAVRQQMLNTSCDDYIVRARFYVNNRYGRAQNKIELYLLDNLGKRIGKLMIKDNGNSMENMVHIQVGSDSSTSGASKGVYNSDTDKKVKTTKKNSLSKKPVKFKTTKKVTVKKNGKKKTETVSKSYSYPQSNEENSFTDFYGYLELRKIGNKFTAKVQKLDSKGKEIKNGTYTSKVYTDSTGKFSKALAGVAVYMAKYDISEDTLKQKYKPNIVKLCDLRVYNVLEKATTTVIAEKGDELIIDCDNKVIYKNGYIYLEDVYIGSVFPQLDPKEPSMFAMSPAPSTDVKWSVTYHPKFY